MLMLFVKRIFHLRSEQPPEQVSICMWISFGRRTHIHIYPATDTYLVNNEIQFVYTSLVDFSSFIFLFFILNLFCFFLWKLGQQILPKRNQQETAEMKVKSKTTSSSMLRNSIYKTSMAVLSRYTCIYFDLALKIYRKEPLWVMRIWNGRTHERRLRHTPAKKRIIEYQ